MQTQSGITGTRYPEHFPGKVGMYSGSEHCEEHGRLGGSALPSSHFARSMGWYTWWWVGGQSLFVWPQAQTEYKPEKGAAFSQRSCPNSATAHLYCQRTPGPARLYVLFTAQSLATRSRIWRLRAQPLEPDSLGWTSEQMGIFLYLSFPIIRKDVILKAAPECRFERWVG